VRFPDSGLQSVVYIGEFDQARQQFHVVGTGFLVFRQRPGMEPSIYLVTADHVVKGLSNDQDFAIRLNDKTGASQIILSPRNSQLKWWRHHKDKSVDAAVFGWGVRSDRYAFKVFPSTRFDTSANRARTMIGIGDEIFIVGLFRILEGKDSITPIVRFGHIAMMAKERIDINGYGRALVHLVEAEVIRGLSGSPVYVHETVSVPIPKETADDAPFLDGVGNLYLLGLVHGYYPMSSLEEGLSKDSDDRFHSGVSVVVPAEQILEIIDQPALVAFERGLHEVS
jgi:hypothetical protein